MSNKLYTRLLYQRVTGLSLDTIEQCACETYHTWNDTDLNNYLDWLERKVAELQEIVDKPKRNEKNKGSLSGQATKHIWNETSDTGL